MVNIQRNKLLFVLVAIHFAQVVYAQTKQEDSLKAIISISKNDSIKIETYIKWSDLIYATDQLKNKEICNKIIELCNLNLKKSNRSKKHQRYYNTKLAWAYSCLGLYYEQNDDYKKARKYHLLALGIRKQQQDLSAIAGSYNNIGMTYESEGNNTEAYSYYLKSLRTFEKSLIGKKGEKLKTLELQISTLYNNIALVFQNQQEFKSADSCFKLALVNREKYNDIEGKTMSYINMANLDLIQNKINAATSNYSKAMNLIPELNNKAYEAYIYTNLGTCYTYKELHDSALYFFEKARTLSIELGDISTLVAIDCNSGTIYLEKGNLNKARMLLDEALENALQIRHKDFIKNCYHTLTRIDSASNDYKNAYQNYKNFVIYRDSIINEENTKKIVESQLQYEFDKKEAATKAAQDKKDAMSKAEKERQQMILVLVAGVLVLVFVFAAFIFRSLRRTKKQKQIIEEQKKEVELQKHLVEEKQKEILDSIRYAKRIQLALLPSEKYFDKNLNKKRSA